MCQRLSFGSAARSQPSGEFYTESRQPPVLSQVPVRAGCGAYPGGTMDFNLPDDLREVQATIRDFMLTRVEDRAQEIEHTNSVPPELIKEAADLGLFGLSIPEEYGGVGLSSLGRCAVYEAMGQGHMGFGGMISAHASIGTSGLVKLGNEEQKQRFLPRMAAGECIAGFAITEPSSGSDAGNIRTKAVKKGDVYVLNGTKHYISNAPIAGLLTVIAITDPAQGSRGMSAFLVEPQSTPGVSIGKIDEKMGQKGALSAEVIFEDAEIPAANLLGPENRGYREAAWRARSAARVVGRSGPAAACAAGFAGRCQCGRPLPHPRRGCAPDRVRYRRPRRGKARSPPPRSGCAGRCCRACRWRGRPAPAPRR